MAVSSDTLDFTFLDGVNRVLRTLTFIQGDDDDVTTFSDTQHAANIQLAKISIQDELGDLVANRMIDLEFISASLSLSSGARVYNLPSDFIRFAGDPFFYHANRNYHVYEYPGGRRRLRIEIPNYQTQSGQPNWWYWEPSSRKQVGFYLVPDSAYTLTYEYQRSVHVDMAADELPFHNQEEADAFCQMASRRMKYMYERAEDMQLSLDNDMMYRSAKSRLYNLMNPREPRRAWAKTYV